MLTQVWLDRFHCINYNLCIEQNGSKFGFILLTDFKTNKGPSIQWDSEPDIWQAHQLICESKVPNFFNCHFPVKTQLNPDKWREYLFNYWNKQLHDLIQYGFPFDFDRNSLLISSD